MALLFFTVSLQNQPLVYHFLYWYPVPLLRWGQWRRTPLTTACVPPFWFTQNTFLEHHVTTRQQTIMEKGSIKFKHYSRLKFSRLFAKLLATTALHKYDPIIHLITTPLRMCRGIGMHAYRSVCTGVSLLIMTWNNTRKHFLKDHLFFFRAHSRFMLDCSQ